MKIGISTGCLYPMTTENAVRTLLEHGFTIFEIFFNTFSELEPDYIDRLNSLFEKYNAEVHSIHPFTSSYESYLLFSAYERRFHDGIKFYEMYFRTAARLNAKKVVLHGMRDAFVSISDEEYCRRFLLLSRRAACYGIEFLQENVDQFYSNRPIFLKEMRRIIPEYAGFVLDVKQALRGGHSPCEFARIMGDKLRHVHISDCSPTGGCVLPGKGCFDYSEFFSTLKEIKYEGDVIIEVYRTSYENISDLAEAGNFLSKFIRNKE